VQQQLQLQLQQQLQLRGFFASLRMTATAEADHYGMTRKKDKDRSQFSAMTSKKDNGLKRRAVKVLR
jgi:hypothetical protein